MKSSEKQVIINNLQEQIDSYNHFYLADISGLNAEDTSDLRRLCFKQDVKLVVVKNTLLRKALENSEKNTEELYDALKGNTSVMFTENGNVPAKLISWRGPRLGSVVSGESFRKLRSSRERP